MTTTTHPTPPAPSAEPSVDEVLRTVTRRSFATLATASATNRPHVAGVLYAAAGGSLYVSTRRTSRKARNIAANRDVFVCIPVRRLPVGPPSSVQFAAQADILDPADPEIRRLAAAGGIKAITGHGELELPGGCFLRITPTGRIHTYGIGMSLRRLLRDPLDAGGSIDLGRRSFTG